MSNKSLKPHVVIGAEHLTAALYKDGDEFAGFNYRFNIVSLDVKSGCVVQWFRPADIRALLKLIQVLAAELDHDGCTNTNMRQQLRRIAALVEKLLHELTIDGDSEK